MEEIKKDMKEVHVKLDKITAMVVTNTASLTEHMKRTELNEKRIEKIEYYILGLLGSALLALLVKLGLH